MLLCSMCDRCVYGSPRVLTRARKVYYLVYSVLFSSICFEIDERHVPPKFRRQKKCCLNQTDGILIRAKLTRLDLTSSQKKIAKYERQCSGTSLGFWGQTYVPSSEIGSVCSYRFWLWTSNGKFDFATLAYNFRLRIVNIFLILIQNLGYVGD